MMASFTDKPMITDGLVSWCIYVSFGLNELIGIWAWSLSGTSYLRPAPKLICHHSHPYEGIVYTVRPRQDGHHFADDIFKCIFVIENVRISLKFSMKFVSKIQMNNIPALVQMMAWRQPGDKPLSEPMMVSLLIHIYITRPQWVKWPD